MERFSIVSRIRKREYIAIAFMFELRQYLLYLSCLLGACFIYYGFSEWKKIGDDHADAIITVVFGILMILVTPIRLAVTFGRRYDKSLLATEISYMIDNDGIYFDYGSERRKLSWRELTKVKESKGFLILIYPSGSHFFRINSLSTRERSFIMSNIEK